jgi:hypothetical protein
MTGKPASLLLSQRDARRYLQVGRLFLVLSLLCSLPAFSSAIKTVTLGPISVVRGDLVSLSVDPVDQASTIEWWVGSDIVCQKARCEVDTTDFTPGEYSYYVVVRNSAGVEIAEVRVSSEAAPPLYKPKTMGSESVGPNKKLTFVANGEWLLIPRFGLVGASRKSTSNKTAATDFAEKPLNGHKYRVGAGGSAILRRVGYFEEWILAENSFFMIESGGVSLLSGAGVWRKLKLGEQRVSKSKIYGVMVEAKEDQVIVATPAQQGKSGIRAEIRNLQGPDVKAVCAGDRQLLLPSKSKLQLEKSIICKIEGPTSKDLSDSVVSEAFPRWTNRREAVVADHWRAENEKLRLMGPVDKGLNGYVNQAFEGGKCSDVLDFTGSVSAIEDDDLMKRARCQLMFGLRDDSLKNLKSLESAEFDPPLTALMLARAYYQLNDISEALDWYKKAYTRGYTDRTGLSREAVDAARDAGLTRSQLAWLDSVALNEEQAEKLPEAQRTAGAFRKNRPKGAEIGFGIFMDTQAVPINAQKIESMPNHMPASRGAVGALQGAWWQTMGITAQNSLTARGHHGVRWPTGEKQPPYTISKHDLKLGFMSEFGLTDAGDPGGRWLLQPSVVIGTGTLGASRARDRYGWEFDLSYVSERSYSFTLMSDKYLDPNPTALKNVDIDLYRYTVPADFSHLDFILRAKISAPGEAFSWWIALYYGSIDYRARSLAGLDHDLVRIEFNSNLRLSRSVTVQVHPRYEQLNSKNLSSTSSEMSVETMASWRFMPLWSGGASVAYEVRDISDDTVGSWNRLVYGLSLLTDL